MSQRRKRSERRQEQAAREAATAAAWAEWAAKAHAGTLPRDPLDIALDKAVALLKTPLAKRAQP